MEYTYKVPVTAEQKSYIVSQLTERQTIVEYIQGLISRDKEIHEDLVRYMPEPEK